jgi:hypothetical protein
MKSIISIAKKYSHFFPISIIIIEVLYSIFAQPYMWFDESVQFFISKGLSYDIVSSSNINSASVLNVIERNGINNHDPGGFSIILHFWSKITNNYAYLRSLNLIIFIFVLIVWYKTIKIFFANKNIAFTIIGISLIANSLCIPHMAVELRAYMMEIMAISIGLYIIIITNKHAPGNTKLQSIAFGALLIFSTARYSTLLYTLAIFAYCILHNKELNKKMIFFLIIFIVLIAMTYCYALIIQNPKIHTMSYLTYLNSIQNIRVVIVENQSYLLMLSFLIYTRVFKLIRNAKIVNIVNFAILLNLIFIFTSIFSKYPYMPNSNRGLVFSLFTILTFLILIFDMFKTLSHFTPYFCLAISAYAIAKHDSIIRDHSDKLIKMAFMKINTTIPVNSKTYCSWGFGISLKAYELTTHIKLNNDKIDFQPMPPHNNWSEKKICTTISSDYNFVIQSGFEKILVQNRKLKETNLMDGSVTLVQYAK